MIDTVRTVGSSVAEVPGGLLERTDELSTLHGCASEVAETAHGQFALVYGEAGIGKTALLRQFCGALPRRFTVLWGACDPLFAPRPLGPLLAPAEELGGEAATLVTGEARPYDVARAVLAGLRGCAPSVLVLEDLQWGDEATLDVVRLLARRVESAPALVVLSFRDDCLHRTHPLGVVVGELPRQVVGARIELGGLSRAAVRELASATAIDAVDLHSRTAGNPFFVTEVLAAGGEAVPATVREAVLARIARLRAPARDLLDAVAVVPQRSEVWLLESMTGGALVALDECLRSGVLRAEADGVVFRHELARQTIEGSLSPARAIALHRAALVALAENLLGSGDLARLAHHAEAANDAAAVLRYAPAAGEQAAALGAPREAERQYMRTLRFAGHLEPVERAELQERFAEHAYIGTQRAGAAEILSEAIDTRRRAGDLLGEAAVLRSRARLLSCIGRFPEAREDVVEAVKLLERVPPGPELASARESYAAYRSEEDLADAVRLAREAAAVAEQVGDPEVMASTIGTLGNMRMLLGDEGGAADLQRNLAISIDQGFTIDAGSTFIALASGLGLFARWREVAKIADAGIEYSREHGLDAWVRCLITARALADLELGNWDAATEPAHELLANPDDPIIEVRLGCRVVLALVRARRGDPGYWPLLDEAQQIAAENEAVSHRAQVAIARAEAAWLEGRADAIASETDELYPTLLRIGHAALAGELAVWRQRAGVLTEAPALSLPEHHRLLLAGDGAGAAKILNEGGARYAAALALIDKDDPTALRETHKELRALGAAPAAARAARRLRDLGERAIPRGPRPRTQANAAGLTARELDVLPLLIEGLRNTEIAERLIVSPKTIDHHVSAILHKLDVRNRGQVGAAAARLKLINSGAR
jgi:DNA-binding CsgD family transcriptional regulator/tetratricopeptide (TPR) repeat protein